jgi:hypothetical protein
LDPANAEGALMQTAQILLDRRQGQAQGC